MGLHYTQNHQYISVTWLPLVANKMLPHSAYVTGTWKLMDPTPCHINVTMVWTDLSMTLATLSEYQAAFGKY